MYGMIRAHPSACRGADPGYQIQNRGEEGKIVGKGHCDF